jgi:hypothetical protein
MAWQDHASSSPSLKGGINLRLCEKKPCALGPPLSGWILSSTATSRRLFLPVRAAVTVLRKFGTNVYGRTALHWHSHDDRDGPP